MTGIKIIICIADQGYDKIQLMRQRTFSVRVRTSSAFTFRRTAGPSSLIGPIAASEHTWEMRSVVWECDRG